MCLYQYNPKEHKEPFNLLKKIFKTKKPIYKVNWDISSNMIGIGHLDSYRSNNH